MTSQLEQLSGSSHTCFIYQNVDQQVSVTAQFLKLGLDNGEKCVFLDMPEKLARVRLALKDLGVDTAAAEQRKALELTAKREFLDRGRFNQEKIMQFLGETLKETLKQGFTGLRVTGDMNWELGSDQDFNLLVQYEAELDRYVKGQQIVGMCQYQRYSVSSLAISNALETHESVILGTQFCADNLYYEPPEIKLEEDSSRREQRRGEWMCRQLTRVIPTASTLANVS